MKIPPLSLIAAIWAASAAQAHAQTINWGSEFFSDFRDSKGVTLDENEFVFQLGAFANNFQPDETNTALWYSNWRIFDQAGYNEASGYFTSTVQMQDNGTGNSTYQTSGAPSFEGMKAYLWVRNNDNAAQGSEWLLASTTAWVFPNAIPGCCDNGLPVEWSISDLGPGDVPEWGRQGDASGPGTFTSSGSHTLQTYSFLQAIPEPSAVFLLGLAAFAVFRRQRPD